MLANLSSEMIIDVADRDRDAVQDPRFHDEQRVVAAATTRVRRPRHMSYSAHCENQRRWRDR